MRLLTLPLIFSLTFASRSIKIFNFSIREIFSAETDSGIVFNLPDGENIASPGAPNLPAIGITLPLPPGSRATGIKIVNVEYETLPDGFSIAPAQPPAILSLPRPSQCRGTRQYIREKTHIPKNPVSLPTRVVSGKSPLPPF